MTGASHLGEDVGGRERVGRCCCYVLWALEVKRVQRDEDGLAALLAAGVTPREHLDQLAERLEPYRAAQVKRPLLSMEMLPADFKGRIFTFEGTAKLKSEAGSASFAVWCLPGWTLEHAEGRALARVTVN
ncbi:hypothetical protein PybrP1_005968 [[Pythium] brassicae (nom. inval.)]|nr:hypothetical protein PybrP1_005968 [[Pythium] brassicae (nom. inval.)]